MKSRPQSDSLNTPTETKVAMVSLGCPKNQVDAEVIAGLLAREGFLFTAQPEDAQVIIVNTCSFIAPAVEEAKAALREMSELKQNGTCRVLLCTGCLPQRKDAFENAEFPAVDAFLGVDDIPNIGAVIRRLLEGVGEGSAQVSAPTFLYDDTTPRLVSTPPWSAYIKIAEGCLHNCSFCTIPAIRGRYRSRSVQSVVAEAATLAAREVKELVLVAQDTTAFGRDNKDKDENLPRLLSRLNEVEGLHWIRLMYAYPGEISDELLDTIAACKKVCRYIDIPLQHASAGLLRQMRRAGSGEDYLKMIGRIRRVLPDVALRSAFIVGFPGETQDDFEELLSFLSAAQLDRVGAFTYFCEKGTAAAEMPGRISADIAQARYHDLMLHQQKISLACNRNWIGQHMEVLVESTEESRMIGRSFRDAPEIDGTVILTAEKNEGEYSAGDFVIAHIEEATEYDLIGCVEKNSRKNSL